MARWKWKRMAVHMLNPKFPEKNESICWIRGRRGVSLTTNPDRVTCKFCKKILEEKNIEK